MCNSFYYSNKIAVKGHKYKCYEGKIMVATTIYQMTLIHEQIHNHEPTILSFIHWYLKQHVPFYI